MLYLEKYGDNISLAEVRAALCDVCDRLRVEAFRHSDGSEATEESLRHSEPVEESCVPLHSYGSIAGILRHSEAESAGRSEESLRHSEPVEESRATPDPSLRYTPHQDDVHCHFGADLARLSRHSDETTVPLHHWEANPAAPFCHSEGASATPRHSDGSEATEESLRHSEPVEESRDTPDPSLRYTPHQDDALCHFVVNPAGTSRHSEVESAVPFHHWEVNSAGTSRHSEGASATPRHSDGSVATEESCDTGGASFPPHPLRVIAIPPDYTRLNSLAGPITKMLYDYWGEALTDVMPALGTHTPMTAEQKADMFAGVPAELFRDHNFRSDVVEVGSVPADVISELSEGKICEPLPLEVNKLLLEPGIDYIFSVGQVVPHEVIGMANYTKNIFVGVGGARGINLSHFIGASYGMERLMGKAHSPVRDALEYGKEHFLKGLPIIYVLTVLAKNYESGQMELKGLFVGDDFECYARAAALSGKVNFIHLPEALKTCVVYLDPTEFKSTWLGNKAIYRTRMALADGAELVVLAPGLREFGEDAVMDVLIRRYGYKGTSRTLLAVEQNKELRDNLGAAAHLIHGSSEGRFTITYCPGEQMSEEEIRSVGFNYLPFDVAAEKYDLAHLKNGMNPGGVYYISNPALGLWSAK